MMRPLERMRKRQVEEEKRKILFLILAAMVTLFVFGVLIGISVQANESKEYLLEEKYYANIEIQPGDTIYSLAEEYMDNHWRDYKDYANEVLAINHIGNADRIISGQHLILPYYL